MSKICVIGSGYVGLVTGTCFADLGNEVVCVDVDEAKVRGLQQGVLPIYEPGLESLVRRNVSAHRLSFTTSHAEGVHRSDFVFIAVNTPSGSDGEADLSQVRSAAEGIADLLVDGVVVVNKSTVPIGTGDLVTAIIEQGRPALVFHVVSNPEFLREGSAILDFMQPDRIVLGAADRSAAEKVSALYSTFHCPIIITDLRTAEMIKYASNAFLATRISFINEMAAICDELGADVVEVARGMGLDKRIGSIYLEAGLGFGGSCFPKDVRALAHMAEIHGQHPQLLRSVMEINRDQRLMVVRRLRNTLGTLVGRVIAVLGLSFKPDTDDIREAAALEVIRLLQNEGARVRVYDPVAMTKAAEETREVEFCPDAYTAAQGCDALVVVTEWNEFKQLDRVRLRNAMRHPVVIDGRNLYDPREMRELGFLYVGVGRGYDRARMAGAANRGESERVAGARGH